jgi:Holliday junction resolvase
MKSKKKMPSAINTRKARSRTHEQHVARATGGDVVPGSGSLGSPGDVRTKVLLIDCKSTELRSRPLDMEEIEKITAEAEAEGLTPALAFEFLGLKPGVEPDWALVPLRFIVAMTRRTSGVEQP